MLAPLQDSVSSYASICPCKLENGGIIRRKRLSFGFLVSRNAQIRRWRIGAHVSNSDAGLLCSTSKAQKLLVSDRLSNELVCEESKSDLVEEPIKMGSTSTFTNYQEDPLVDKLRTQLGSIHPIPSPPINRSIVGFFVFFFFVGVVFDKLWTSRKRNKLVRDVNPGTWPQVPTSFSLFLEKDLQRKESVEWVNMVLGKLWKVYRGGIENWIIGLLQPVIDNLKKPDYVRRVEIKQFSLGEEPLSVRNVERKTSRRVNDLQ